MKSWMMMALGLSLGSNLAQDCGGSGEGATVSGQVRVVPACSAGPSQPLERARVDVYDGSGLLTYGFTDASGDYRFDLEDGSYKLAIYPPPDYPTSIGVEVSGQDVTVDTVVAKTVFAPREVIVDFYDDVSEQRIIQIGAEAGIVTLDPLGWNNIYLVGLAEEEHVTEGITTFEAFSEVEYAEPNYLFCPA